MVSFTRMQSAGQGRSYLSKENYHLKESEIGHIYSLNPQLLKTLGVEFGQQIDADIHTALLDGYKHDSVKYTQMIAAKEAINIIGKELENNLQKIENRENRIEYLTTLISSQKLNVKEIFDLQEQISRTKNKLSKLNKDKVQVKKNQDEINRKIEENNLELKDLKSKFYRGEQEIKDIEEYKNNNQVNEKEAQKLENEILKNKELIRQLLPKIEKLENEISKNLSLKDDNEKEAQKLENEIKSLTQDISISAAKLKSSSLSKSETNKYKRELKNKTNELEKLKSDSDLQKNELEKSIHTHKNLHDELALFNNSGSDERRAGFDITSSAVKDLSLIMEWAHEHNYELWEQLQEIHYSANLEMMNEFTNYVEARLSTDEFGNRRKVSAQPVWSTFNHSVTREIDNQINPQVHTHNFIYNMCQITDDETGKIWALQLDKFYSKDVQAYLGTVYQNNVAAKLLEMGFELELTDKYGNFKIKGLDAEKVAEFSATSKMIISHLEEWRQKYPNKSDAELKDMINNEFKKTKKELDREALYQTNNKRLDDIGLKAEISELVTLLSSKKLEKNQELIAEFLQKAYKSITLTESTFSKETLLKETLRQCTHLGITASDVKGAIASDKEIIQLADNVYTTQEIKTKEFEIVQNLKNKNFIIDKNDKKIDEYLKKNNITLNPGQARALKMVRSKSEQFQIIQGDAGSGKTFAMKILADVYAEEFDVLGFAPTAKAAGGLAKAAGIDAQTIDKYLIKPIEKQKKQRLLIVDESSMIDSLKMYEFMQKAIENNDKVVFIGDTKQLQSVGAGKIFYDMQRFGGLTTFVTENMRQESIFDKKIVDLMKNGKSEEVVKRLDSNIFEAQKDELIDEIVKDYKKGDLIIAQKNADRHELNSKIRAKLGYKGDLAPALSNINTTDSSRFLAKSYPLATIIEANKIEGLRFGQKLEIVDYGNENELIVQTVAKKPRTLKIKLDLNTIDKLQFFEQKNIPLAKGDRVIFTKNMEVKGLPKLQNGGTAVVKKFQNDYITLVTDGGREFTTHINKLPYLDYGYAVTDFKSQGMTVKNVKVLIDERMTTFNSFYTQLTRFKSKIQAYTTNKAELADLILREAQKSTTLDYSKGLSNEQNIFTKTSGHVLHKPDHSEPRRGLFAAGSHNMRTLRDVAVVSDSKRVDMLLQVDELDFVDQNAGKSTPNFVRYADAHGERIQNDRSNETGGKLIMQNINEIKQNLHPYHVVSLIGDSQSDYQITKTSDTNEYRIQHNLKDRKYSISDFLTKFKKFEWAKAKEILEEAWAKFGDKIPEIKIEKSIFVKQEEQKKIKAQKIKEANQKVITAALKNHMADYLPSSEWAIDKARSTRNYAAMKNLKNGDKIIISKAENGTYKYFNPQNDADKGTLKQFLENRGVKGHTAQAEYIKKPRDAKHEHLSVANQSHSIDVANREWGELSKIDEQNNYMIDKRKISASTYMPYAEQIKIDKHGNIATPMYHSQILPTTKKEAFLFSGYNSKLINYYAPQGQQIKDLCHGAKTTTVLRPQNEPKNIVITESVIDALSYIELKKLEPSTTMILTTNGQTNQKILNDITKLSDRFPKASKTVAMDNDAAGDRFSKQLQAHLENIKIDKPIEKDWNDELKKQKEQMEEAQKQQQKGQDYAL